MHRPRTIPFFARLFLAVLAASCDSGRTLAGGGDTPPDGVDSAGDTEPDADSSTDADAEADADASAEAEAAAEATADADSSADADAEADADADADGSDAGGTCGGECLAGLRTACTCDPSDPCGWASDTICDERRCMDVVTTYFDDGSDCTGRNSCGGDCRDGTFNACTCDPRDPCRWSPDGACDEPDCEAAVPDGPIFDDSTDCIAMVCDGACAGSVHDACTCAADDPCGWAGDGYCDGDPCEAVLPGAHFDDAADCTPPGSLTFAATSVINELDRNDMAVFADGMTGLGYSWIVRDADVTRAELVSYLESDLTALYHTGHGNDGVVLTSDGTLSRTDATLAVRNTIFATCLTLVPPWNSAMGPSAETVLGYTDLSYDYIDDDVVRNMIPELGAGRSWMFAWYQANIPIRELADRWAGYVREGASIVEYSARSATIPTAPAPPGGWVALGAGGRLWASAALLADARTFDVPDALPVFRSSVPRSSTAVPDAWSRLAPTTMTREEAVALAEASLPGSFGSVPADAVLDRAFAVFARREGESPVIVGWVLRWSRELDGVPIRGNGVADHLAVLVGPSGALATSSWWPALDVAPASPPPSDVLLDSSSALRAASAGLSRVVKGDLRLVSARPVWGTIGPGGYELVPAWEFTGTTGSAVVIDALTGKLLR
ncbi:MAG: hypothetical protein HY905_10705 [Deltaproteobacteria bacterium]|nr:hypothetical protein [Deltaproteobacteria bacterium]